MLVFRVLLTLTLTLLVQVGLLLASNVAPAPAMLVREVVAVFNLLNMGKLETLDADFT